ncbi:MAG: ATP-binding protein [Thermodesulfobacteriota bacterium]|nr:ATP-binding protein [Thermodesulfobacteriota bacterium]
MHVYAFNPWWRTARVPRGQVGQKRHVFGQIASFLDYRQILVLFGLRRAGKTTLMYQLIDDLLTRRKVNPLCILYFSFDQQSLSLDQLLETYQQDVLKHRLDEEGRVYLFLDEIQKLDDWFNKVKLLYDQYPNLKIVLSGSAALILKKETKESLAGRFFEFSIKPFTFDEFLEFKGVSIDKTREDLYKLEIINMFREYVKKGGFIEAADFEDLVLKKYFRESLLERVIFRDIPESFPITRPQLLFRLLEITADIPGMYLDYKNLANDLKVDQRTISGYVSYLAYSLLVTKLYNFSSNKLTSEKKLKRLYLSNTGFTSALRADEPGFHRLLEGYFADLFEARFFYRSPQKEEVDLVIDRAGTIVPVEIKIREKIKTGDIKPLVRFGRRFQCSRCFIVSGAEERVEQMGDLTLTILPFWRHWSIMEEIKGATGE